MAKIGERNQLEVVKKLDFGCYLDGGNEGEILIPRQYVPEGTEVGDVLDVFIYFDSEDRIIATTLQPKVMLGEIAKLQVVSVTQVGAFLDWGLAKDLFVPFKEQKQRMEQGKWYIVGLYIDHQTNRLAASAKVEQFLDNIPPQYEPNQEVELLIFAKTEMGYTAIINHTHTGMLYQNEVFRTLRIGDKVTGYIKKVREDEKIDLILDKPGYGKIDDTSQAILERLKESGGFLSLTDKTEPETIYYYLGISKKVFKKAIGSLYKERLITIDDDGIRLLP